MAGVKQESDGKWQIDRAFLTPERATILAKLDKKHEASKAAKRADS